MNIVPTANSQQLALRGDGRLFTGALSVSDETAIEAGLAFPSFTVDQGLHILKGGLVVRTLLL
jgi:hypothetical protein